jgi:hypothetical protein
VSAQLFSEAGTDRRSSAGEVRTALNGLQRIAVASQAIRQRGVGDQGRLAPRELFGVFIRSERMATAQIRPTILFEASMMSQLIGQSLRQIWGS